MEPNSPWSMPWVQPENLGAIMHFEAHTSFVDENARRALLHVKRKPDENPAVSVPPKQFITEEKITAHFNGLHISSNFGKNDPSMSSSSSSMEDDSSMGSLTPMFSNFQEYRVTAKELEEKLRNANRITLCEDFKKMHEEHQKISLIPEALLNRIEKPCTSLVLWQPPPILDLLHRKNDEELKEGSEAKNTNTNKQDEIIQDIEFSDDIDDFIDNNNTCNIDYNKFGNGDMDEDL